MPQRRYRIEWPGEDGVLAAVEPTMDEVAAHADELAEAYNDPHNAPMMGHTESYSVKDVVEHFRQMREEGARPFLLFRDGRLMGDADVRGMDAGRAEFAVMVGARAAQGKGLGTRFALMLHAFAFRVLALGRLYVTIVPKNAASRRLFEKLGYQLAQDVAARAYVDEEDDIAMSIARADFERRHAGALDGIRIVAR
ncbi:MAG TPA: GNAT family N-acetyltransferase [Haliangiales bacterium]|nr:GNAT family N-acetyltransferase [Haliangiales bacterium]